MQGGNYVQDDKNNYKRSFGDDRPGVITYCKYYYKIYPVER